MINNLFDGLTTEDLGSVFLEDVCPEPRKRGRKCKNNKLKQRELNKQETGETRGAYLMRILGLSKSNNRTEVKVKKAAVIAPSFEKYKIQAERKWSFDKKDFYIEAATHYGKPCYAVKHKTWKTQVYGGESYNDAEIFINKYIEESKKPIMKRSTNFIHLIHS